MAATSTQLVCPHCGSTLSFGSEIPAGTPVECLICMQSFAAVGSQESAARSPDPAVASQESGVKNQAAPETLSDTITGSLPKMPPIAKAKAANVPVAKPASTEIAPAPIPTATPAYAGPGAELPAPPPVRKPVRSPGAGMAALVAVTLGLAFLLAGGIVFAIVKINTRTADAGADPTQLAANGNKPSDNPAGQGDPNGAPDNQGATNAVLSDEENEQLRIKIREETKQLLKRKISANLGDGQPEWGSVDTVTVGNGGNGGNGGAGIVAKQQFVGLTQQKINDAIDRGIVYLRSSQQAVGTWGQGHGVGHAAIGGLTLLECKVPATDPAVQRAAMYVRANVGNLNMTYELSLAILFLDRLGDKKDRTVIQGLAMRLLAGQNDCGGWSYNCPILTPQEMQQLFNFLQSNKKPNLLNPLQGKTQGAAHAEPAVDAPEFDSPLKQYPVLAQVPGPQPKMQPKMPGKMPMIRPDMLQGNLQNLPVVRNQAFQKGKMNLRRGGGDNSNTQFALIALWTARRHDVPSETALLAAFQRFTTSQNGDGGWGYTPGNGSTNTMTSVGLLGLAMGHGAAPDIIRFNPKDPKDVVVKPALEDPKIQTGLQALARNIGEPRTDGNANFPMQNLYFLWSVERVAMLYDLKTIGGKDWYAWGAQILVHNQLADGSWPTGFYHGSNPALNTCFALLFLKRSNLVQDLTNNLRLYTGIRESEK